MVDKPSCLVCMRLKDMRVTHPDQDNSRRCSKCGKRVGIYPSGQAVLRTHQDLPIICQVCNDDGTPFIGKPVPGAIEEALESRDRRR